LDSTPLTLNEIQKLVNEWISQFEEGYWPPLSMLASIVEEVGELSRELNDLEGFKKKRSSEKTSLALELADVIFSIACVANYYDVNLEDAFRSVMQKYTTRDAERWTLKKKRTS
jgi:NTP pyrophosphatase (non-canonical NTP hydrolase)